MKFNFTVSQLLLSRFSESPNKDFFSEGSKLELFLELNHLNMGSTKTRNPESGNRNGITETETEMETEYGIKYQ